MSSRLAVRALLAACALLLPIFSLAQDCAWASSKDTVFPLPGAAARQLSIPAPDVRAIATSGGDCGVWVLDGDSLRRYAADGALAVQVALRADARVGAKRREPPRLLAADPYDGSVWLAGDKLLAHVSASGAMLPSPVYDDVPRAIAVGLDQSVSVLDSRGLQRFDVAGHVLSRTDLTSDASPQFRYLAVDTLHGVTWVSTQRDLLRVRAAAAHAVLRTSTPIAGIALEPATGRAWLAEARALRLLDANGALLRNVDVSSLDHAPIELLAYDPTAGKLWLWTRDGLARLSAAGDVELRIAAQPVSGLFAMPAFALRPVVELVEPPAQAVTSNDRRSIVLAYRAQCPSQPCDAGAAYLAGLSLDARLNGVQVGPAFVFNAASGQATYTPPSPLPQGINTLTAQLKDSLGRGSNTVSATFTVDSIAPVVTVASPQQGLVTTTAAQVVSGTVSEPATVLVNDVPAGAATVSFSKPVTLTPGVNTFVVTAIDAAGNAGQAQVSVRLDAQPPPPPPDAGALPPDPSVVATPVDVSVPTRLGESTAFLYTGANPIQTGVVPGTIDLRRAAVLRGRVLTREGAALPRVKVTVKDHPEFGQTLSREDGWFDLAVNGGGLVTLNYEGQGLLPAQRTVDTPWGDWVQVPDAALVVLDTRVNRIDFASGVAQTARSSPVTDANGTRQVTMLFPSGITASLLMPDGSSSPAASLNVRATEYTVGAGGVRAMPGPLPPTTDYTYAVELGADEAIAAGARSVVFSQPVPVYVDNFLGFPVGTTVPSGYYDRGKAAWIGSDNGRVIRVLAVEAGLAVLDVNGQGQAASAAHLARLGIGDEERVQLASLFTPGQSMWRVPVRHFTPYDFNWIRHRGGVPKGCNQTGCVAQDPKPDPLTCEAAGCIIETQNQVLGEAIAITGTPHALRYRSSRVPGYKGGSTLRIPLTDAAPPEGLLHIKLEVLVAGKLFTLQFDPAPELTHLFLWDGKDAYGRTVAGRQAAQVRIGYVFKSPWLLTSEVLDGATATAEAWGLPGTLDGPLGSDEITSWASFQAALDAPVPGTSQHLGGWGLDVNHVYDSERGLLMRGDGSVLDTPVLAVDTHTQPGVGSWTVPPGLAIQADGSVLVSGGLGTAATGGLRRIAPSGDVASLTGTATARSVTHRLGGGIYITGAVGIGGRDGIYRVNADGTLTVIAGVPTAAQPTDPANAAIRQLIYPRRIAADREGNIYFTQQVRRQGSSVVGDCRVRRVNLSGTIGDIAGNGSCFNPGGDGGPALAAGMQQPEDIAVDDAGNVYFTDGLVVRKVTAGGQISTVAGMRSSGDASDGRPATQTWLGVPNPTGQQPLVLGVQAISVDRAGELLISTWNRVLRLGADGLLHTVFGSTAATCTQPAPRGTPAAGACTRGLGATATDAQGRIFVMENGAVAGDYVLRRIDPMLPAEVQGEVFVAEGGLVHVFDASGRHRRTLDAKLNTTLLAFDYDAQGRLVVMRDADARQTRVERTASGVASAIVSPEGQRTTLGFGADGYLAQVTNPAGETHAMQYSADGLLTRFTNPRGASNDYGYDVTGLLRQDRDAAGGGWDIVRDPDTGEVTMTSAAGRPTKYRNIGGIERVVRSPDGTESRSFRWPDATSLLLKPNGTRVLREEAPDPRFGMQVPLDKRTLVTLPSGLAFEQTATRTASTSGDLLNLTTQTDTVTIGGKSWVSTFDAAARTQTITTPLGRKSVVKLDAKAKPVESGMAGMAAVTYAYDAEGRLASASQGAGNEARGMTMQYDALGRLASITDTLGQTTGYGYDAANRVTRTTLPDGRVVAFAYDANGNLASLTPPSRPAHAFAYTPVDLQERYDPPAVEGVAAPATRYSYDLDKLLTAITRPDGLTIAFGRDAAGRVATVTTPTGVTEYSYDTTSGELVGVNAPGGIGLAYSYDGDLLISESWRGTVDGSVSRSWNANFDLQALDVAGRRYGFAYDDDRLLTAAGDMTIARDAANGFVRGTQLGAFATSQAYNPFGELQSHSASFGGAALFAQSFTYDRAGRIVGKTEQASGLVDSFAYGYDAAGRLASVSKNGAQLTRYQYDANGNRTSDGVNTATYDAQDRLLQYGEASYTYSDNGELKSKRVGAAVTQYDYDVLGNLRKVVMPDGKVIEYVIDGRNRRIGRKVDGVLEFGLLYLDQLNPVAQLDGQGNVIARFVYGTRANVPDYMEKGGRSYRFVTDQLGSVRMVVDTATGEVAQRMEYDAFGVVLQDSNPGFQPFGFAGGLRDVDTGLTRFGARDYDAAAGRWTAKDPIRFGGGDTNLMAYVGGDPIRYADPTGHSPVVAGAAIGALFGAASAGYGAFTGGGTPSAILTAMLAGGAVGGISGAATVVGGAGAMGTFLFNFAMGVEGNLLGQGLAYIHPADPCKRSVPSLEQAVGAGVATATAGVFTPFAGTSAAGVAGATAAGFSADLAINSIFSSLFPNQTSSSKGK